MTGQLAANQYSISRGIYPLLSYDIIEAWVRLLWVCLCEKNVPRHMPQREDIEHRIMPLRTECDSTFLSFLKEISGINDRPLLCTDQNTPAPKRCWEVRANRACSHAMNCRENKNVPFDRISPTLLGGKAPTIL